MKTLFVAAVFCATTSWAQAATEEAQLNLPAPKQATPSQTTWHRRWLASLAPLVASQALDSASSYGMRELNPLLASSNGSFETKAVGIKIGVTGAAVAVEYLLVKKYPRTAKFFSVVNLSAAGVTTGVAIHNYAIK